MVQPTKIMIVDDNPIDHMITKYILKHNFSIENVTVMECVDDALDFLVERQNNITDLPELIILDLDMPCINGFGFLERFAKLNQHLIRKCKIVVLTGSDVLEDLAKIKASPYVKELISKPLSKSSLTDLI